MGMRVLWDLWKTSFGYFALWKTNFGYFCRAVVFWHLPPWQGQAELDHWDLENWVTDVHLAGWIKWIKVWFIRIKEVRERKLKWKDNKHLLCASSRNRWLQHVMCYQILGRYPRLRIPLGKPKLPNPGSTPTWSKNPCSYMLYPGGSHSTFQGQEPINSETVSQYVKCHLSPCKKAITQKLPK